MDENGYDNQDKFLPAGLEKEDLLTLEQIQNLSKISPEDATRIYLEQEDYKRDYQYRQFSR